MATPMGPPSLPGFSLRVQLFSPNAHATGDKPMRCFRVVTSPDCTIREFCQEASRIHEINYGQPIAIKKCQDDQEFDVTQSEIVGNLFTNTAFIRVIQAAANSSIRDSVPPNSALRYDPALNANRKRDRAGSVQSNGAASSSWNPNKRQRVSNLDPDQPIPSRENGLEVIQEDQGVRNIIPNSQQSAENERHVRLEILESPTPSPPPALLRHSYNEIHSTDQQSQKPVILEQPQIITQPSPSRANAPAPRSTSASYHISRPNERGRSVSTAATSPLDSEPQLPQHNHVKPIQRQISDPILPPRVNGKPASRSPNEQSIYENIESDSEVSTAALNKTKATLKSKNSPRNGLSGLEYANKFSTPTNRHSSQSREQNSELPLTPNSKQREETQQANDTRSARKQAAEAVEQRRREASVQRKEAEEAQRKKQAIAKMMAKRDAAEKEAEEKRQAIIAKAQRIEKERVEKLEREQEVERQKEEAERLKQEEQARIKAEKLQRLEREKQARLEQQRQEAERREQEEREQARVEEERLKAERIEREEAEAEAARLRQKEERGKEVAAAEEKRLNEKEKAISKRKSSSGSLESGRSRSETPIRPGARPQSSTSFIPSGRKSALKHTSSQAVSSSSPIATRTSPLEKGEKIPVPDTHSRRVSFNIEDAHVRPEMPPPAIVPSKPAKLNEVPKEKQSTTRILPPSIGRSSRNATPLGKPRQPIVPPKTSTPAKSSSAIIPPNRSTTPQVVIYPPPSKKGIAQETASKENSKPAARREPSPVEISSDDHDSDGDIPAKTSPVKIINDALRPGLKSPAQAIKPEPKQEPKQAPRIETKPALEPEEQDEEEQDEDVEMADNVSSDRESRSPVIFNQHTSSNPVPPLELQAPADEAETQSITDSESEDGENEENEESSDEEEEEDDQDEVEEEEESTVQVPQSSIELPRPKPTSQASPSAGKGRENQLHSSNSSTASQPQKLVKSTPNNLPHSSLPPSSRPRFTQGASLSSMNAARQSPAINSNQVKINGFSPRGAEKKVEVSESEEESEEESEDEESSEESGEEDEEKNAKDLETQLKQAKKVPLPDSDSNSDDESSEEPSDGSDEEAHIRNELAADVARMTASRGGSQESKSSQSRSQNSQSSNRKGGSSTSQKSISSLNITKTYKRLGKRAGSDLLKEVKKKRDDKYLNGYQFSQYT